MEDDNIVQIEIRDGEFYDFYRCPPENILKNTGYVYIITRTNPGAKNDDFLFIGTSCDLPRLIKKKHVKTFMEVKGATHLLIFRIDPLDEMEIMKEEIVEKYPSILQEFKVRKVSRVLS